MSSQRIAKERFMRLNENYNGPANEGDLVEFWIEADAQLEQLRDSISYLFETAEDVDDQETMSHLNDIATHLDGIENILSLYTQDDNVSV